MKKTILTFAIFLGATVAVKAQALPTTDKLIDEMGNQYDLGSPEAFMGEDLYMNSQGKVTRANGTVVGYAIKIGSGMNDEESTHDNQIDDLIKNLGGADSLKKMAGL